MKWLNDSIKGVLKVFTWILTYIEVYLLAAVLTSMVLGFAVLTVSIFSVVPPILSDKFWVLFLCISLPLSLILMIYVIVKIYKDGKQAKILSKKLAEEAKAKEETEKTRAKAKEAEAVKKETRK